MTQPTVIDSPTGTPAEIAAAQQAVNDAAHAFVYAAGANREDRGETFRTAYARLRELNGGQPVVLSPHQ